MEDRMLEILASAMERTLEDGWRPLLFICCQLLLLDIDKTYVEF
jgi:hypothetical protein